MQPNLKAVPDLTGATISIDGEKVTINKLTVSNQELASFLSTKEGPEQLLALIELLELALYMFRLANTSADVQELNSVAKQVQNVMESAGEDAFKDLDRMLRDQADETKPQALINILKTKLVSAVVSELDPTKESSPFHAISNNLIELLQKGSGDAAAKAAFDGSTTKGLDFEALLDVMVQKESVVHGDDALFTGDTPSPSGDKYGDEVVTLNPEITNGEIINIVWEAKTDKSFKDTKGRLKRDKVAEELENGIENREAVCGIFVSDTRGIDLNLQPAWQEFEGNKLIILLDHDDPDQRIIRMAYLWARAYALKSIAPEDGDVDIVAINRLLASMQREFDGLANLKRLHTPIKKNIEAAITFVEEFEENLDGIMEELKELLDAAGEVEEEDE